MAPLPQIVVYWAADIASPAGVVSQYPGDAVGWAASVAPRKTEGGMNWIIVEDGQAQLSLTGMNEWLDENTIPTSPTFEWWEQQVKTYNSEQYFIYETDRRDW